MAQMNSDNDAVEAPRAGPDVVVAAFYLFTPLRRLSEMKKSLKILGDRCAVHGLVLLANEGINATIAGPRAGIDAVLVWLREQPELAKLEHKESIAKRMPFHRLKVQIKAEIVTFKQAAANPHAQVGTYVEARDWNALIGSPDVVVVDVRNDFEVQIGTFVRAINPHTTSFTDFAVFVDTQLGAERDKKVAMFCTGGIRCEKATSFLMAQGFKDVYHLSGGILKYLEEVPEEETKWQGECFVFDQRVTVGHRLEQGKWRLCHACYAPLNEEAQASADYEVGVSCPRCVGTFDEVKVAGLRERQRQMTLAEQRQERHMGKVMPGRRQL